MNNKNIIASLICLTSLNSFSMRQDEVLKTTIESSTDKECIDKLVKVAGRLLGLSTSSALKKVFEVIDVVEGSSFAEMCSKCEKMIEEKDKINLLLNPLASEKDLLQLRILENMNLRYKNDKFISEVPQGAKAQKKSEKHMTFIFKKRKELDAKKEELDAELMSVDSSLKKEFEKHSETFKKHEEIENSFLKLVLKALELKPELVKRFDHSFEEKIKKTEGDCERQNWVLRDAIGNYINE